MSSEAFFERLDQQFQKELPFVVYRKPNQNILQGILQESGDLIITKDFSETGFVFSPFDSNNETILIPKGSSEQIYCETFEPDIKVSNQRIAEITEDEKAKEKHIKLVAKGKSYIKATEANKIVLSRKEQITVKEGNPLHIFKRLLSKYQSAFVYCWYHPKVGLWLGATPETLVKIEGKQFSIMSLAGTQEYQGSLDVRWRDKELQEQQYVTDYIVERIKMTVDDIQVSGVQTVKAANLLHLKTKIWGTLKDTSFSLKDFLFHLHPTPAVCGLPKEKAKKFILENENYDRQYYTGFLGELNMSSVKIARRSKLNIENRAYNINQKSTQLYVNLRCMSLDDLNASVYVGGGITSYSDPEEEWQETVAKAAVIKSVL